MSIQSRHPPRQSARPPMPQPPFLPETAAPYPILLDVYPYPAFVVRLSATMRPVWANRAFYAAFGAPGIPLADCFVHALATTDDGERYGLWSAAGEEQSRTRPGRKRARADDDDEPEPSVTVRVRAIGEEGLLQLVKSQIDDLLVITSVVASAPQLTNRASPVPPKRVRDDSFAGSLAPLAALRLDSNQPLLTPDMTPVLPHRSPASPCSPTNGSKPSRAARTLGAVDPAPCPTATQTLLDSHPWESTPLGPRSAWSERLRACVNFMQTSPHATALWWGSEYVLLYNDAYSQIIGHKHPYLYGQRAAVGWAELWDMLGPRMKSLVAGKAISKTDDLLFFDALTAAKLPMETYHTWVWVPCADESGKVLGVLNYSIEMTPKVIASRRMDCLRELGSSAVRAATRAEYYQSVLATLEQYPHEFSCFSSDEAPEADMIVVLRLRYFIPSPWSRRAKI
ncbi:hypothetical protein FRC06_008308 [Ceratobasidium sp. 370]|nr:hypothetical protein FRC06_008308 [Ceratobasidium sp. 370]